MPRMTSESEGKAACAASSPTTRKSACPMTIVVLATMTEGKPSVSGTQGRTSHALTASPPTEAVGVVRLNASPARRAARSEGKGTASRRKA